MSSSLYIVATPIGNLGDISQRAIDTLKAVDMIAAEDTRHSRFLLQSYSITTPLTSYHEHNEEQVTEKYLQLLQDGQSIALISDAGTPLINDPGYKLVAAAIEKGIPVVPVPGPSAMVAALSVCGLPTHRFAFEGYLPAKTAARQKLLSTLANETRTLIFYETPHRIHDALKDMAEIFGKQRRITVARELTKQYEQIILATIADMLQKLDDKTITKKGEFVLVVEGAPTASADDDEVCRVLTILNEKLGSKDAAALTARITGRKKNEVYKLLLDNNEQ